MKKYQLIYLSITILLVSSCSSPSPEITTGQQPAFVLSPTLSVKGETESKSETPEPNPTETDVVIEHLMQPTDVVPAPASWVDDVESSGTAAEKRAPYGDSFDLNRFERPFLEDMTYVPDLDVHRFGLSQDSDWYYVSILLIGNDPNNALGIDYGVELDQNLDGSGDFIIWAHPPYTSNWNTNTVQVFEDTNGDTGGSSVIRPENVFSGDGYETLFFDGGSGQNDDPDLAWVRLGDGPDATIQFALKKSWAGNSFMFGVVADAGLKDVSLYDYMDRFTPAEAGSPVRGKEEYPLGYLYAVDNTCWEAYGFTATGYEPKICPPILQPVNKPDNKSNNAPPSCNPPPDCGGGPYDPNTCTCQ